MKLILFFFLFYIHISYSMKCIDGFTPVNGKCLRLIKTDKMNFDELRRQCNLLGGTIVSIRNSIDNTAVAQLPFSNSEPIWIGLQCSVDLSPSSCIWDDQIGNASTYSNFAASHPKTSIGKCVYMYRTGSLSGKWFSGYCEARTTGTVCETDPVGQCSHSNNDGYCYYPLGDLTAAEAQKACSQNCNGNLVSIHSASENNYVKSIFKDPSKRHVRIGLNSSGSSSTWIDGSSFDYSNIVYTNNDIGSCYSLALVNELFEAGKWSSSNCSSQLPSICKWVPGSSCLAPTIAPSQCTGPEFLYYTGTIYSPNYPHAYTATNVDSCYYVLTAPSYQSVLWFDEFDLDPSSSIELYSSIDGETPFAVLNKYTPKVLTTTFTADIIKMVFKPCTTNCDLSTRYPTTVVCIAYKWKVIYGRDFKDDASRYCLTNGVFSSPNYPNIYPSGENTLYTLYNPSGTSIKLHFDVLDTEENSDYVNIYDGATTSSSTIASLSGKYSESSANLTYISTGQFMTVNFNRSSTNRYHIGFRARLSVYP